MAIIRLALSKSVEKETKNSFIQLHGDNLINATASFNVADILEYNMVEVGYVKDGVETETISYVLQVKEATFAIQVPEHEKERLEKMLEVEKND